MIDDEGFQLVWINFIAAAIYQVFVPSVDLEVPVFFPGYQVSHGQPSVNDLFLCLFRIPPISLEHMPTPEGQFSDLPIRKSFSRGSVYDTGLRSLDGFTDIFLSDMKRCWIRASDPQTGTHL